MIGAQLSVNPQPYAFLFGHTYHYHHNNEI